MSGIATVSMSITYLYSIELKSPFGTGSLPLMLVSFSAVRCVLWLNYRPTSYPKMSEEVNKKEQETEQLFQSERYTTLHQVTDRETDDSVMPIAP